jgi:imidazolonepropionase-like amidohydrolase
MVLACGGRSPAPPPPHPTATSAGAVTTKRVVISQGQPAGTSVTTVGPDGRLTIAFDSHWNGRGPKSDAVIELAADGTIASLTAVGHHMMLTPEDERFTRDGARARWKNLEESGDAEVHGPAMFVPMSDLPDWSGLVVAAALRNGGSVPLLPAGEARVERGPTTTVDGPDGPRTITCYAVSGVDLVPFYTWMNQDGSWWGMTYDYWSVVPEGSEAAIDALVALQLQRDREHEAAMARQHAHTPPAAGLAYTHARVLDVDRGAWLDDHAVVVVGGAITWVGPSAQAPLAAGVEVVDLRGKALLPGMIDMHGHLAEGEGELHLASGVTTVRDVGNDPDRLDDYKARFDAGTAIGPRVFRYGLIEGRGDKALAAAVTAETAAEARAGVQSYFDRGYDGIKIYNSVKVELVPVIVEAAHARGMRVTGHVPVHMLAEEAVRAGYDGIEHINMLFLNFLATHDTDTRDTTRFTLIGDQATAVDLQSARVQQFLELLRQRQTVIDPTLNAFESLFAGEAGAIIPGMETLAARMPANYQRGLKLNGLPDMDHAQYLRSWQCVLDLVRALYLAQVPLVIGTDNTAGIMFHHELALFVKAGVPPAAALQMATLGAARALGADAELGSIAVGKRADLVVVDGDPLRRITDVGRVVSTMRGGVVYPSPPLYAAHGIQALVE